MRRIVLGILSAAIFVALPAISGHAQFIQDHKPNKTGRTDDGLKADAEIDRLYRARAGQKTPEVRSDPWGDVRAVPAQPGSQPSAKTSTKPKN